MTLGHRPTRTAAFCSATLLGLAALNSGAASLGAVARVDSPMCWGKTPTIAAIEAESVQGTSGNDVIVASPETYVQAGEGDDLVCGSARVNAGRGDDKVLYASRTGIPADSVRFPFVYGAQGNDRIVFTGAVSKNILINGGDGRDSIRFRGAGTVNGSGKADRIVQVDQGPSGLPGNLPSTIYGSTGRDYISGGGGRDTLFGGEENGAPKPDGFADVLVGGPGRDSLNGGDRTDQCYPDTKRGHTARHC